MEALIQYLLCLSRVYKDLFIREEDSPRNILITLYNKIRYKILLFIFAVHPRQLVTEAREEFMP